MLPLVLILVMLVGCQSHKVVDETQYVSGNITEKLDRSRILIDNKDYKGALLQLQSLSHQDLTVDQSRWVRDEIVKLYYHDHDYEKLIAYLESRDNLRQVSFSEKSENLFDIAECYHKLSYNHWAKSLGIGKAYRRYKSAKQAEKYYEEFLRLYPDSIHVDYVKLELESLKIYFADYKINLDKRKKDRSKV